MKRYIIKMLDWLKNLIFDVKIERSQQITLQELQSIARETFKGNTITFFIGDSYYYTCKTSEVEGFLRWFKIYSSNRRWSFYHDCDNFTDFFMGISKAINPGIAIGKVWVKTGPRTAHALNCFYDDNKVFHYIEPQTSKIIKVEQRPQYKPYFINF